MGQGYTNQVPPQNNTTVVVASGESTSGLAIAGLVFNILGWLTCGAMSLLGVPLSFLALFARGPKGTAIAGLIVGFPGVIFFALMGAGMILGFLGIGAAGAAAKAQIEMQQQLEAEKQKQSAEAPVAQEKEHPQVDAQSPPLESSMKPGTDPNDNKPPTESAKEPEETKAKASSVIEEKKIIENPIDPKKIPRIWNDSVGKFSTEAVFNGIAGKTDVFLKKSDGKVVKVPIEKLSDEDKAWLQENAGWKPE